VAYGISTKPPGLDAGRLDKRSVGQPDGRRLGRLFDLEARICCRFAADVATANHRPNHLVRLVGSRAAKPAFPLCIVIVQCRIIARVQERSKSSAATAISNRCITR
jgi:hypothetical protein